MHRPKEIWTGKAKNIHSASIISLDLNVKKLLFLYGKNKADLDFACFCLLSLMYFSTGK